ncbi:hypothetical protein [Gemmiger formicilis]
MKKLATFILALAMAAMCAVPAMAEGPDSSAPPTSSGTTASSGKTITESTSQSSETKVQFDLGAAYMVTIPSEVTLVKNDKNKTVTYESDLPLKASNVRLEKGKELHITISKANGYKLTAGGAELAYTIDGKTPSTTDVVATFETKAPEQTKKLHIKAAAPNSPVNIPAR